MWKEVNTPPRMRQEEGGMIYLAIDNGSEGWSLEKYATAEAALEAVRKGNTYGYEWKILRELKVSVEAADD